MSSMDWQYLMIAFFLLVTSEIKKVVGMETQAVQLRENEPIGTIVTDFSFFLVNRRRKSSRKNFQLLSERLSTPMPQAKGNSPWFSLDRKTGILALNQIIDRETICGSFDFCSVFVQVYVITASRIIELQVDIIDVNDNPPIFQTDYVSLNVSEEADVGSLIDLDDYIATDKDTGNNSAISYSLNPNSSFGLAQYIDDSGITHLKLEVKETLDYESRKIFSLTLFANDQGEPSLSSHIPLQIIIVNENDNKPQFSEAEYFVRLPEDTPPGRIVTQVHATDPDSGLTGAVTYVIAGPNKKLMSSFFALNSVTGEITLTKQIDREEFDEFNIFIEAWDGGVQTEVGRTRLVVYVDDVNDNAPHIVVTFIAQEKNDTVYIAENIPVNFDLAYVSAKDNDVIANGDVTISMEVFSLTEGKMYSAKSNAFRLNDENLVYVNEPLDAETQTHYKIILNATDGGRELKWTSKEFHVVVLDVNDHAPQFAKKVFELFILEDVPVGKEIAQMRAIDLDLKNKFPVQVNEDNEVIASANGNITYSLVGGEGIFSIHPITGIVTLVSALDREQKEKWTVAVMATDGGIFEPQTATCQLIVNVVDTNDNSPVFIDPATKGATFYGTIKRNHVITRIQAIDHDSERNGEIKYNILLIDDLQPDLHANKSLFIIDHASGDLRINMSYAGLTSSLGQHSIVVQARDQGYPPMISKQSLNVIVTDAKMIPVANTSEKTLMSFSSLLLLIISCSSVFLFITIVLVGIFISRKKQNRKKKKNCRIENDSLTSSATLRSNQSFCTKQKESFDKTCMEKVIIIEGNRQKIQTNGNPDLVLQAQPGFPDSNQTENTNLLATVLPEEIKKPKTKHDEELSYYHLPRNGSREQRDFHVSKENTYLLGKHEYVCLERFHPRCSQKCLIVGHGDTCWLPDHEQSKSVTATLHTGDNSYPYVSLRKSRIHKNSNKDENILTVDNKLEPNKPCLYSEDVSEYRYLQKSVCNNSSLETVSSSLLRGRFPIDPFRSKLDSALVGSSTDTGYMTEVEIV